MSLRSITLNLDKVFCLNYSDSINDFHFKKHYYIIFHFHGERYKNYHDLQYHRISNSPWQKHFNVKWSRGFFKTDDRLNVKKSWTEVDELCRSAGGTLPIIRSKDELKELISLLQFEKGLPPIELIYIGFQFNPQVSKRLPRDRPSCTDTFICIHKNNKKLWDDKAHFIAIFSDNC